MRSTINTAKCGAINIESSPGLVTSNGAELLPHEAALLGFELQRAAKSAMDEGRSFVRQGMDSYAAKYHAKSTDKAGA